MKENLTTHSLLLKCNGFEWNIKISNISYQKLQGEMRLITKTTELKEAVFNLVNFDCSTEDFIRMADYIDTHVENIKKDSLIDSDVFTIYGLDFQLQALCGEVDENNEGEFTLRIMFLFGNASDESRVYVGMEGIVDIEQCYNFTKEIRQYLK